MRRGNPGIAGAPPPAACRSAVALSFALAPHPLAVREARERVRELPDLPPRTIADAELVVSELVANALLHANPAAGSMIDITVSRGERHVVIDVDDHGRFTGRPRHCGLGVKVLDTLCECWNADHGRVAASLRF